MLYMIRLEVLPSFTKINGYQHIETSDVSHLKFNKYFIFEFSASFLFQSVVILDSDKQLPICVLKA